MMLYYLASFAAGARSKRSGIRMGNMVLLLSSLFFYAWGEQWLVFVMLGSTLIDFTCGWVIAGRPGADESLENLRTKSMQRGFIRKTALIVSICANLSILGFFKYFNFGIENFTHLAGMLGVDVGHWNRLFQISLPLGISFYTFQSMSYTIDVYRGETRATRNLLDFACFVTLFPQLVAGPIVRYRDIASQLIDRVVTLELFASGVGRFILGLGKKVLVANTVAVVADKIWKIPNDQLSPEIAWLGITCYTIQIYFDFSGYS
ncbi:MAG: MBOAT family O-acyltransferase, partial [Planctomycetota bacterium]